jgi:DNA-binding NarL/FixJ family response regulator
VRLVSEGLSNRDIARRLFISENTAANHVRSILAKTGSENRTQAAMYAAAQGLLT